MTVPASSQPAGFSSTITATARTTCSARARRGSFLMAPRPAPARRSSCPWAALGSTVGALGENLITAVYSGNGALDPSTSPGAGVYVYAGPMVTNVVVSGSQWTQNF